MEHQICRDSYEHLFSNEYLQNLLRPPGLHRQFPEHIPESRDRQTGPFEFLFDPLLRQRFFGRQLYGASRAVNEITGDVYRADGEGRAGLFQTAAPSDFRPWREF